ncbi:unnamed protein product, partial [Ectocarpus sp. 8 AP-2014]
QATGAEKLLRKHPLLHPSGGRAHPRAPVAGGDHALPGDGGQKNHAHGPVLHQRSSSLRAFGTVRRRPPTPGRHAQEEDALLRHRHPR